MKLLFVAVLALASTFAVADDILATTVLSATSGGSIMQSYDSAGSSWTSNTLLSNSNTTSINSIAGCANGAYFYVFWIQSSATIFRRRYTISSTGMLSNPADLVDVKIGTDASIRTAVGSSTFSNMPNLQSLFCVDDLLFVSDSDTGNRGIYYLDYNSDSATWKAFATGQSSVSDVASGLTLTRPYGMFVTSLVGQVSLTLYYANSGDSTSTNNGVYKRGITRNAVTGSTGTGTTNDQWSDDNSAYYLAVDTAGFAWFTNSAADLLRTSQSSTVADVNLNSASSFDDGMRYSRQRLYYSIGSSVRYNSNPTTATSITTSSDTTVYTPAVGTVNAIAVYYAGGAGAVVPTFFVAALAALVAALRRFA